MVANSQEHNNILSALTSLDRRMQDALTRISTAIETSENCGITLNPDPEVNNLINNLNKLAKDIARIKKNVQDYAQRNVLVGTYGIKVDKYAESVSNAEKWALEFEEQARQAEKNAQFGS